MSLPRLPFLYPQLFKHYRVIDSAPAFQPIHRVHKHPRRPFCSDSRKLQNFSQRYGPAAEQIHESQSEKPVEKSHTKPKDTIKPTSKAAKASKPETSNDGQAPKKKKDAGTEPEPLTKESEKKSDTPAISTVESHAKQSPEPPNLEPPSKPLEKVLHMEAPTAPKPPDQKPPHLQATPYVHHFDTYTLVKDLGQGGFTQDQSITIMKSVRSLLAANLELAKDGLVSKSDIENETYLFRAACSELRTEIQNSRQTASEKLRSERAHLQHEVDILNQRVTQDSLTLKDDLKGMLDDRKMAVRMEQRSMESAIQELNYKITVDLQGDTKGEVEGLRWFLARRAAMFIVSMAVLILGSLRYATYMTHLQEKERKQLAANAPPPSENANGNAKPTVISRHVGTQTGDGDTDAMLASLESSSSPSYVSLG